MLVCASTECFPEISLTDVCSALVDLGFSSVEIAVHESGNTLKPSQVVNDFSKAVDQLHATHRLGITALSVDFGTTGDAYYEQFTACCRLAKAAKIVSLIVPAAELGTPFNEEVERLQELVRIASLEGVLVALKTQTGCMTQDPDTAVVLCNQAKGLGLCLDPSHFIFGPHQGRPIDKVIPFVYHVHIRDTTKDQMQVRVGQGEVDFSRLMTQLVAAKYSRSLSVHMTPVEDVDHAAEMRKTRLLLESFL